MTYYGGKLSLVSQLLPLVPAHEVYTETFFGGGALFFAKQPAKNETINDCSNVVVNFYTVLKKSFRSLNALIDSSIYSRALHVHAQRVLRDHSRGKKQDRVELAWAFWYTSNFSFSCKIYAGFKYSNVQNTCLPEIMASKKAQFTELLAKRIEHAYIENRDAMWVLKSRNVANAFHYIDPPYFFGDGNTPADHGHYKKVFSTERYLELLDFLQHRCKGKFMLSNYPSAALSSAALSCGWNLQTHVTRVAAPRKTGTAKSEVIVYNYPSPSLGLQLFD